MASEIERKFLVNLAAIELTTAASASVRQGYVVEGDVEGDTVQRLRRPPAVYRGRGLQLDKVEIALAPE